MKINKKYDYLSIQKKWDKKWKEAKIYQPDLDSAKKPYYVLYMFPYPSAEGLHVGHAFSGTGADVYARFMRMKGYDVFHPMGFDAFGIHSENYALKINDHPKNLIDRATKHFREQFDSLGFSYDWTHSVNTSSQDYYKWTQWIFIQLFKAGLAEKKKALVNWCPSCKTVLADEQVLQKSKIKNQKSKIEDERTEDRVGVCERCETEVEMRELEQWFFKITKYADRLLEGLDRIDWTEKVKLAQRNWIGRSEGARIEFRIQNSEFRIEVFTTRPDTLFGATFMVVSPHHPLVQKLLDKNFQFPISNFQLEQVRKYVENTKKKTGLPAEALDRAKEGVFSGFYAINPVTAEKIPVWIADYVVMEYGTGAIMGVPAHDERDFDFAKKYNLPIRAVIQNSSEAYMGEGKLINSGDWNGWNSQKDFHKILSWLEDKKIGKIETRYHLRDWLISRQRYWGTPIPIIYCRKCWKSKLKIKNEKSKIEYGRDYIEIEGEDYAIVPVPEKDLPVVLPYIENFKPLGSGIAPLAQDEKFVNTTCPVCSGPAKRETDVADTFLDSSWYFLRYPATESDKIPFPSKAFVSENSDNSEIRTKSDSLTIRNSGSSEYSESSGMVKRTKFLPVNMYIGGAEHSVLHLLYSRFITKVLFDQKLIDFDEPFTKFRAHGLLIKDGAKMSKSRGNIINPDDHIKRFGADTLRCYLMFLGPFNQGGDFRDSGIEGMERFLKRVRKLVEASLTKKNQSDKKSATNSSSLDLEKSMNRGIKGVGNDVENLRYNTALAKIMEYVNDLTRSNHIIDLKYLKTLIIILAPFAPYLAEELWSELGGLNSVHREAWPSYNESILSEEEATVAVQVNGKLRGTIKVQSSKLKVQNYIEKMARSHQKVSKYIESKQIKKVIYVPGKILNFVV